MTFLYAVHEPSTAEFPGLGVFLFSCQERSVFLHCVNLPFDSLFPISLKLCLFYCHKTHSHLYLSLLNRSYLSPWYGNKDHRVSSCEGCMLQHD